MKNIIETLNGHPNVDNFILNSAKERMFRIDSSHEDLLERVKENLVEVPPMYELEGLADDTHKTKVYYWNNVIVFVYNDQYYMTGNSNLNDLSIKVLGKKFRKILISHSRRAEKIVVGTLDYLINQYFGYTLEVGHSWNKKIQRYPNFQSSEIV